MFCFSSLRCFLAAAAPGLMGLVKQRQRWTSYQLSAIICQLSAIRCETQVKFSPNICLRHNWDILYELSNSSNFLANFFSQAQLASLMALSTQGGEVPLRLFAQHQASCFFNTKLFFFVTSDILVFQPRYIFCNIRHSAFSTKIYFCNIRQPAFST